MDTEPVIWLEGNLSFSVPFSAVKVRDMEQAGVDVNDPFEILEYIGNDWVNFVDLEDCHIEKSS